MWHQPAIHQQWEPGIAHTLLQTLGLLLGLVRCRQRASHVVEGEHQVVAVIQLCGQQHLHLCGTWEELGYETSTWGRVGSLGMLQ